jgi:hypothetical protein
MRARRSQPAFARRSHRGAWALTLALLAAACAETGPVALLAPDAPALTPRVVPGAGACRPDAKLIGRILLSVEDLPGTWWHLTRTGLDAAGLTNHQSAIESLVGQSFATLDDAIAYLVGVVSPLDTNLNNYVCAYELRGTRTSFGDPNFAYYYFTVLDDQ